MSLVRLVLLSVALLSSVSAAAQDSLCFDAVVSGISVPVAGTTEVCSQVYENPAAPRWGATILAVHGFTETAATWQPLADAIFADNGLRYFVKRVIAVDLPGHGDSPAPLGLEGRLFGELTIFDNVSVVIQTIEFLRGAGLSPRVLMGHSMGGLAVQGVQEALLSQGSSLADLGVRRAVLLAPVPAAGQQWTQPPPSDLGAFVLTTPEYGSVLSLPPAVAQFGGGFTTLSGTQASGTPGLEELAFYVGDEPLVTTLQLVGGIPELPRPGARKGAFAPVRGTLLSVVSFSQDVLVPAQDLQPLYEHLIGRRGLLYRAVTGPEAVHSMHITDPEGVVDQLKSLPLVF